MNGRQHTELYEILGVDVTCTKSEIKKAYHKAALSSHPDKVPETEREEAEIRFKAVSQAYEVLYDDDKRAHYDRFGLGDSSHGPDMDGEVDLEDLLNSMFMGGMGGMGGMPGMHGFPGMGGMPGSSSGGPGARRKGKGKDVVEDYEITLEEVYKGKTLKMATTRNAFCTQCKGTGGKEKAKPKKCSVCGGKGWKNTLRQVGHGLMAQEQTDCGNCRGTGEVFSDKQKCKKCKGNCVLEEKKILEVYIPRGSKAGDKIVLEGEADDQPNMETGNIVFVLDEKPHDVFTREGADLAAEIEVTMKEALCGFSRVVLKHLDGRGINIEHPAGKILRDGQVLKIPGEGMPYKKGDQRGDLYLTVKYVYPTEAWISEPGNVDKLRSSLPETKVKTVEADVVDNVEYDSKASLDTFGDVDENGKNAWEDDDEYDDEDGAPQCAQQ